MSHQSSNQTKSSLCKELTSRPATRTPIHSFGCGSTLRGSNALTSPPPQNLANLVIVETLQRTNQTVPLITQISAAPAWQLWWRQQPLVTLTVPTV